ncbi:TetR family transcriptional regulator [Nocardia pseudobrasiliensis]|uniref:TetR family transcriptional regulator n=1 Tax=Nocardia pseudobrasiliensis TaxID=45979 RepID=A0A370IE13_9NOCA|nr:TetR family transcriptional regulator [Nocardia pseudobrasiliensis]RDI68959.1 TetR family transcriptional regulator [Nocardia pseudobrasiliensis]
MSRWEPNSRERLETAALELYRERGFDRTTVAEIAERAGLTERTFFRQYADKREVLFGGQDLLREIMTKAIAETPASVAAVDVAAVAVLAVAAVMQDRRDQARRRREIIVANPALRERELSKLATLGAAVAEALRARGVAEPAASLIAEAGIAVFKVSFERWLDDPNDREFADHVREAFGVLKAAAAGA